MVVDVVATTTTGCFIMRLRSQLAVLDETGFVFDDLLVCVFVWLGDRRRSSANTKKNSFKMSENLEIELFFIK